MARITKVQNTIVTIAPSWSVSDKINNRSIFSFVITDMKTLTSMDVGDTVSITEDATVLFAGIIKGIVETETIPGLLYYRVQAVDNSALADKKLVKKVYDNRTDKYIIEDIVNTYLLDENVTLGTITEGVTVKRAVFNYVSAAKAFDYIIALSGFNWNIDSDSKMQYFNRNEYNAPFELNDSLVHKKFSRNRNMNKYRNVQYTVGGLGRTATQTKEKPTPAPDGTSKTFVLRYPIAEEPTLYINDVVVPDTDVGLNGIDTGKKWYWTYGSTQITQDLSETILTAGTKLEGTYIGLNRLFGVVESPSQIDARQLAEPNTSGRYEFLTEEKSITTSEQLLEFGDGLINQYAEVADKVTFTTEQAGLHAGHLLKVSKSLYNINEEYLIDTVKINTIGSKTQYTVTALDGASVGGWEQFFKDLVSKSQTFTINANDVLIVLLNQNEKLGRKGRLIIGTDIQPSICNQITCGLFTCGGTLGSEVIVND